MKKVAFLMVFTALVAVGWTFWASRGLGEQKPNVARDFMQLKLNHAQKVLEGIAIEDYGMIAKHGQAMSLLSQDENWKVFQTPTYRHHSTDFQRVADDMVKHAKEKNLEGVTLAYMGLTMSCVNCHKYTRGIGMARLD